MKKICTLLMTAIIICSVAFTCYAQQGDLSLNDAQATPGETVYLTLTLNKPMDAMAVGVSFNYDEKILQPVEDAFTWELKGAGIKNFDFKKNKGAWAANQVVTVQGDICVLSFLVKEKAKLNQTKVSCTLVVKNGTEESNFMAEAVIGQPCEHEYGAWTATASGFHNKTCTKCEKIVTQTHAWDEGIKVTDSDGKSEQVFTCSVCRGEMRIPYKNIEATPSTEPDTDNKIPTAPTQIPTAPTHEHESDEWYNMDTVPDGVDHDNDFDQDQGNVVIDQQTEPSLEHEEHDHIDGDENNDDVNQDIDHDHDHSVSGIATTPKTDTTIVIAVVAVVMIGAALWAIKKK